MDLFTPVSRDVRQNEAVNKWIKAKGKGTIVACTSFGKTFLAMKSIKLLRTKYPDLSVLILVPTTALKQQWINVLTDNDLIFNIDVQVMMGASQRETSCDLLILDEVHRCAATKLLNVFKVVKYKLILGLTATFERLDGRDVLLAEHAPVVDTITLQEAALNGWIAKYTDYVVIVEPDDLSIYKEYNKEFIQHFEYFGFDFNLAMKMTGPKGFENRKEYTSAICKNPDEWSNILKEVTYHAMGLNRTLAKRKAYIANHPAKLRVAQAIINARPDSKIITFSSNVKTAESFKNGYVFTGKQGKQKNRMTLEEFASEPTGILHTVKLAEEGISIPSVDVGIMLGVNSSKTKAVQTLGRCLRLNGEDKHAEFFTIILAGTVETEWMQKSRSNDNFITLDEENLMLMLQGKPYETYKRKLQQLNFRF